MSVSRLLEELVPFMDHSIDAPQPRACLACLECPQGCKLCQMSIYRLLEELVPFMDHSIDDPAAMRMSGGHHKRKQPSSKVRCQYADRLVLSVHKFLPCAGPSGGSGIVWCHLDGCSLSVVCGSRCIGRP